MAAASAYSRYACAMWPAFSAARPCSYKSQAEGSSAHRGAAAKRHTTAATILTLQVTNRVRKRADDLRATRGGAAQCCRSDGQAGFGGRRRFANSWHECDLRKEPNH